MAQLEFPNTPVGGDTYPAPNGVTYTFDDTIGTGVWTAIATTPPTALSVTAGSISGPTALGSVLTYTPGVASGGTPSSTPPAYTYAQQWYRDGSLIVGATATSYTIVAADQGKSLTVTITATDSVAAQATATTAPFAVPASNALAISSAGTISGTASSGSTLTYSTGTATGGTPAYTYSWVWKRESDNAVLSTNTPTYRLTTDEIGDRVYVELTATDSVAATASADTAVYPASPNLITATPFANLTLLPTGAPNASPAATSFGTYHGLGSTNWNAANPTPTSLTSTGALRFQVNSTGGFTSGATSILSGQLLEVIWDPTTIDGTADGVTLNAVLKDTYYQTPFSITVDKNPTYNIPLDTGAAASSTITIAPQFPQSFNAPIKFYHTPPTSDALSNVQVKINGATAVTLPATIGAALTLNPGDSVELFAVMGPTVGTDYSTVINMGSFTGTWVQTATAVPYITAPTITVPPSPLNPSLNSPAGITIQGSTYDPQAGAGSPQTGSTWQVYKGGFPLGPSTGTISAVNAGTNPSRGQIAWKTSGTSDTNPNSQNEVYGKLATDQFNDAAHPLFQWAKSLNIGGYTDWYIPAKNEMAILYFFLKPNSLTNDTPSGSNPNSVSPYTPNTNYANTAGVPTFPTQTTNPNFIYPYGSEAFITAADIWTSTESSSTPTNAWKQYFDGGTQTPSNNKAAVNTARAIRRVPIATYTAAGSPAIGSPFEGGYYGGQISTAGNGIADYALVVAPNVPGTYQYVPGTKPTLSINGADTDGFLPGLTIKGATSMATGIILSVNATTVEYLPTSGTFITGETISTDPTSYTALSGSPYAGVSGALETTFVPKADLTVSTNLYARAQYATTNLAVATSAYGNWAGPIQMASSFLIPPGTPMGGGYFAGQIQVPAGTGTIYNLIVAPVEGNTSGPATGGTLKGQYGGAVATTLEYSPTVAAASNPAQAQDLEYGGTWTATAGGTTTAGLGGIYPLFGWCKHASTGPNGGGGIGGFTDWYIPAKNELEVLYYYLKTTTQNNSISFGSNPNAVAPEPVSTNYTTTNPAQTTADGTGGKGNFQGTNAQAFATTPSAYWSSSENPGVTGNAWKQAFNDGVQSNSAKNNFNYARAIRRIPA